VPNILLTNYAIALVDLRSGFCHVKFAHVNKADEFENNLWCHENVKSWCGIIAHYCHFQYGKFQGDLVKKLKEEKADEIQIQQAVRELKHRKKLLEDKVLLTLQLMNINTWTTIWYVPSRKTVSITSLPSFQLLLCCLKHFWYFTNNIFKF
jgi:hypothetical protein